ncbi:nuclear factor of activated T-cells 5 [Neocloeon triangulifer]|uniref:nuclear factor of activated T-cells 5 n=1 Tax=Neocloeon triangulifer TaxID=2078957 RepID=UPI00286F0D1A|nr:nuclear factor of activated T-cells 5 [Neocloeon triangulifer]
MFLNSSENTAFKSRKQASSTRGRLPAPDQQAKRARLLAPPPADPCDNSNDSGLGVDFNEDESLSGFSRAVTSDGSISLNVISQPESQHRARYQTEGSRGAVKDASGQGHPVVKLDGYDRAAVLQVFIGCDDERMVNPHLFYQACRVSGKTASPCAESCVAGTNVLELTFNKENQFTIICDCVGILKQRNVDVAQRVENACAQKSRKKSTRCRLVFRTQVELPNGMTETLQVLSNPIACTQLPGMPEILKVSRTSSSSEGGKELFVLGKNFLKDSRVVFQGRGWKNEAVPEKEYLQPTHLVCTIPAYCGSSLPETVEMFVRSNSRQSEAVHFTYNQSADGRWGQQVVQPPPQSNVCELLQDLISAKPLPPQSGTSVEKFLSDIEQQPQPSVTAEGDPFYLATAGQTESSVLDPIVQ